MGYKVTIMGDQGDMIDVQPSVAGHLRYQILVNHPMLAFPERKVASLHTSSVIMCQLESFLP